MPQHSYAPVELRERGSLDDPKSSAALRELKVHHVADDDWPTYLKSSLHELLFGSKLNVLLVMMPVAAVSSSQTLTFIAALLALCPLAERLGFVTEQLALHTNATVGGLLKLVPGLRGFL